MAPNYTLFLEQIKIKHLYLECTVYTHSIRFSTKICTMSHSLEIFYFVQRLDYDIYRLTVGCLHNRIICNIWRYNANGPTKYLFILVPAPFLYLICSNFLQRYRLWIFLVLFGTNLHSLSCNFAPKFNWCRNSTF